MPEVLSNLAQNEMAEPPAALTLMAELVVKRLEPDDTAAIFKPS